MNTARALCLTCICVVTIPAVHAQSRSDLVTDTSRQSWSTWTNSGWMRLRVEYQGRFELTDDERDVKSVSPGGSLELTARGWLSLFGRRYTVRGNPDGTVTRRYVVGAAERPLDTTARAWIGETMQTLAKQGFAAEAHMARILAKDGPAGVLNEVSGISSDWVKARYLTRLFTDAQPTAAIAERAIGQTAREIGSDFEKAEVLVTITRAIPFDDVLASSFGRAASTIGSDYEHARVLLAVLDAQSATPVLLATVIGSASPIGSDYEKARVLLRVIESQALDATTRPKLTTAAGTIGSDYERSRVLSALALH